MIKALRHQVGQLFVVGIEGSALTPVERAWLAMLRPGGLILFRRNIESPKQTAALMREVGPLTAAPLLRAVDLEGGLVDRLRDAIAPMPSAAAAGASGDAQRHGRLIGRAIRLMGLNTTFAPVVDLALPPALPVMRTRVVSPDADAVTDYASGFLSGLHAERVLGCAKHFPGLGGGTLDSHAATPSIARNFDQLWAEDLRPYRRLAARLPMIMVAHASYPAVTRNHEPASISTYWISTVLRKRLGYEGLVLSDDLEMGGILSYASIEEAAVQALAVGSDLVEICRDPALVLRAYEAVLREAERSPAFRTKVRTAARRVMTHKERWLDVQMPRDSTAAQLEKLRGDILAFHDHVHAINERVGEGARQ